jgi:hypothetical protein
MPSSDESAKTSAKMERFTLDSACPRTCESKAGERGRFGQQIGQ